MGSEVFQALVGDLLLAVVLFFLFTYVAQLSRGLHGVVTWGAAHLAYTLGATMLDAVAPALAASGRDTAAAMLINSGTAIACGGMAALAWSIIQFTRQRPLRGWELALVPASVGLSLAFWLLYGTADAQGVALSIVELVALSLMIWHLRKLHTRPDRVPAIIMMVGCSLLILLYGSAIPGWALGRFGLDDVWVSADLSIWFMLNFCMLMLSSMRAAESLRRSAMLDPLTGALNRRGLHNELDGQNETLNLDEMLAVIVFDIDEFKKVNDRYGHQGGDLVLQRLGETVRECVRDGDLFARVGGDEFMMILTGAQALASAQLAERIRARVASRTLLPIAGAGGVTVSLGVCQATARDALADVQRCADKALYTAKHRGRNRVETAPFACRE